ncbi:hypothetical protein CF319_g7358 [Tilletia indica]|nr:hypothetical protein CF319_g7358 [Tilletia indica]KAE8229924.1 hypothetical protein CF326_g5089 [Tilletia indica]
MRTDSEDSAAREHAPQMFPSLVDRLNFHSTGVRHSGGPNDNDVSARGSKSTSAATKAKTAASLTGIGKENARGSDKPLARPSSATKSPSLFIPSPRSAPTFASGKGKTREDGQIDAESARSKAAGGNRSVVITLDSSSYSSDDELPSFVASKSRDSASRFSGQSSRLPSPRQSASGLRATKTKKPAGVAESSASSSPSLASWLNIPGSSTRTPHKSPQLGKRRAVEVIEIPDSQEDVHSIQEVSTPRASLAQHAGSSSSASIAGPPSSADRFWDSISASQLDRLEQPVRSRSSVIAQKQAATPLSSRSKRQLPHSASASTGTSRGARTRAVSITDDDDDILAVSGGPPLQSTPAQSRPSASTHHNTREELFPDPDFDDAFLSFYDDDDDALAMIEEQAMASTSTSIRRAHSDSEPIAPPHHIPLSALPEYKRRKYLEQFGNPSNDDDDDVPRRGGGGGARGRYGARSAGRGNDDEVDDDYEDWASDQDERPNKAKTSSSRFTGRKAGGSSSNNSAKAARGSGYRRPYNRGGWSRGRGRGRGSGSRGGW